MATKQFKKIIDGVEYTAQSYGNRQYLRMKKEYTDPVTRLPDEEKLYDVILKNVIVNPPGLDMDDFENIKAVDKVVAFGVAVLQGNYTPIDDNETTDKGTTKGRSKK